MSSSAITRYEDGESVSLTRPPEMVLAEAQQAATVLVKVIGMKDKPVKFNNETYLEFEDWQTVAKFYGCTSKVTETKYVEFGGVQGFEAVAVVLDRNQNEIGRAESMCLNDEENWGAIPKYEWKDILDEKGKRIWDKALRNGKGGYKAEKIQVGTTPKPLFQLRSMAQTRAGAKALRSVFSWVVVLAGYKPTVAEEMTGNEFQGDGADAPQAEAKKAAPEVQRKSAKAGGFPNAAPKKEPVICSECRVEDGHANDCPYHPSNVNPTAKAAAEAEAEHGDAYEAPEPTKEEKFAQKEKAWKEYPGHDPKQHISFKQAGLLFTIQGKVGISEESMKEYMAKNLQVEHRPHIPKNAFSALLDAMDPEFKFHAAPQEG